MPRCVCKYCGLPVVAPFDPAGGGDLFCCYGCYLVSRIVGSGDEPGRHAWNLLRLSVGALLAMNVMMISILLYTGGVEPQAAPVFRWVMLALSTPAMLILGYPFARGAAGEIARGRLSLDTLIALGSFTAFAVSAVNTVRGAGEVYFDTATMLPALVTFGKLIEGTAKSRTARTVRGLETLLPQTALRIEPQGVVEVPVGALRAGDRVRVRPGERIAVDGRILEGRAVIVEAAFTGESAPRICGPGDAVIAGTVNGMRSADPSFVALRATSEGEGGCEVRSADCGTRKEWRHSREGGNPEQDRGLKPAPQVSPRTPASTAIEGLVVQAERVGEEMLLNRIIAMVEQAWERAAPWERIAERAAAAFVPAVLVLAVAAGLCWTLAAGPAKGGMVALAVLVVACPCAMGIATPLATSLAIGRAARAGVLVRGGDAIERIGQVRTVFLDKTGTITSLQPTITRIETLDAAATEEELLGWLAGLESAGEHAVARAALAEARRRGLDIGAVSDFRAFPGQGARGNVTWRGRTREVIAGRESFVEAALEGRAPSRPHGGRDGARPSNKDLTPGICVAWDGKLRGRIVLADDVRPGAAEAVRRLREAGVTTVLLSGDRLAAAEAVAREVGIERVEAPRLPQEKIAAVQDSAQARPVAMVGDGINDAPALAAADVGIALGAGTDLARQAGGVVLLSDRLERVPWLIGLSRRTRRIIVQNLAWAFGYNAVALAAAAAGWLPPLLAAVAMVGSSLTVLANSARIQRFPDR